MTPTPASTDLVFKKSSYSSSHGQNCVEVAEMHVTAAVRDSQHPEQGHLLFSAAEWRAFLEEVKHERL
ncbi:DUF397 domain-containing protein [Nocardiopsis chromatogenes]|uniref:DUF397 domain-containing protein n=1 Tax=Nocardiopsis chromatogenes TaxID=280239 RepID=UPI0003488938|nr:DUF397 domain-containing protein [Nocardiopsis chromatogenes]